MSQTPILIQGTLRADGTVVPDEKPSLPPGRVQVVVQPLPEMPELPKDDPFWQRMQAIWAGQRGPRFRAAQPGGS
jgi:hypothetical protein